MCFGFNGFTVEMWHLWRHHIFTLYKSTRIRAWHSVLEHISNKASLPLFCGQDCEMTHILWSLDLVRKWAARSLQSTQLPGIHFGISPSHLPSCGHAVLLQQAHKLIWQTIALYLPGGGESYVMIGWEECDGPAFFLVCTKSTGGSSWRVKRGILQVADSRKAHSHQKRLNSRVPPQQCE